jgi:hypothetical protein
MAIQIKAGQAMLLCWGRVVVDVVMLNLVLE